MRTFFIVMAGRVLPRAASFGVAVSMFGSMFTITTVMPVGETFLSFGLTWIDYVIILFGCVVWFLISRYEENQSKVADGMGEEAVRIMLEGKSMKFRWAALLIGFALVVSLGVYGPGYDASAFIYRGF
ncbi:MAG: hypothetical protein HUJ79_07590 [Firmicutes bacterium]|nr:hypothetical protein [Bacillota bacterium]